MKLNLRQLGLFLLLFLFAGPALPNSTKHPKLIVVLVIDELDNEQLLMLQPSLSQNGINRISRQGFRLMSVTSSDISGYPGTRITSLFSGTTPSVHGVIGERWFDQRTNRYVEPVTNDAAQIKIGSSLSQSPSMADYLKSVFGPTSRAAAITLNAPWMIHSLGYSPDAFFSLELDNGTFKDAYASGYGEQRWLTDFNNQIRKANYLQRYWGPRNDITSYTEYRFLDDKHKQNFRSFYYGLNGNGSNNGRFRQFAGSPYANTLLRDFTVAFLSNSDFGKDNTPDLLTIGFTARPFVKTNGVLLPAEKEDMLIRLDGDIASLIEFMDVEFGRNNYLLILTAGASSAHDQSTSGRQGLNNGVVEFPKTAALLNLYLMAIHGQGRWVLDIHDNNVYLNHKLIDEKGLSLKEIQEISARFLLQVSGIERTMPTYDLLFDNHAETIYTSNLFPMRTGDIIITLSPGWQTPATEAGTRQSGRSGKNTLPFIIRGWNVSEGAAWLNNLPHYMVTPIILKQLGISHPSDFNVPDVPIFKKGH